MLLKRSFSQSAYFHKRMRGLKPIPIMKQAECLDKVMHKAEKKRLRMATCVPSVTSWGDYARNTLNSPGTRRMVVLNSIAFQHITDLAYSGDYGPLLEERGIQIVETKVTQNYHLLYVYWIHSKDVDEKDVNALLKRLAGDLRFELNALKFMGQVPEIRFVKHIYAQRSDEVNKVISILDGLKETDTKDVSSTVDDPTVNKSKSEWKIQLTPYISNLDVVPIPQMKHDVYDLDHERMTSDILRTKRSPMDMLWKNERVREADKSKREGGWKLDKKELKKLIYQERLQLREARKELIYEAEYNDDDLDETDEEYDNFPEVDLENEHEYDGNGDADLRKS